MDACRNEVNVKGAKNVEIDEERVPRGVAVLFSCARSERAWEHDSLKHGVFFHYVLRGLRGEARVGPGPVTWDLLSAYVKREVTDAVPKLIKGNAKQTPHGVGNLVGDPVLVQIEGEGPPPPAVNGDRPKPGADRDGPKQKPEGTEQPAPRPATVGTRLTVKSPLYGTLTKRDGGEIERVNRFEQDEEVIVLDTTSDRLEIGNETRERRGWLLWSKFDTFLKR